MRAAVEDRESDIETRLLRLLQARFGRFVDLMANSPNATELYDVHGRMCGDIATDAARRADTLLLGVLRRAVAAGELNLTPSGLTVKQLAGVLTDCASGAKGEPAATPADFSSRLRLSVRAILAGVGATDLPD